MILPIFLALSPFALQNAPVPEPYWSFSVMGSGIGDSDLVAIEVNGQPELFCAGSVNTSWRNDLWYALRRDPGSNQWSQAYVAPLLPSGIIRMAAGTLIPGAGISLVVLRADATIEIHDPATGALIRSFATSATSPTSMDLADMDGDGYEEILVVNASRVAIHAASGALRGTGFAGGWDVVAAQMDADSQLEIAVTSGVVLDGASLVSQWTWGAGFGRELAAEDLDGDGRAELVAMEDYNFVWSFNVDLQLPWWSLPTGDNDAMRLADVEGDGSWEVLVGDGQWGDVSCYDAQTMAFEWSIHNPEHGVTDVAVLDVDGDGDKEVIWGAGQSSSGPDFLYIADWQTSQVQWRSEDLDGPFLGPVIGDLDGDGRRELVVASFLSESGYDSGRLVVFDADTLRLKAISPPVAGNRAWTGLHDLELYDVDNDGRDEIAIAADDIRDGLIEIYDYAGGAFTLQWSNPTPLPVGAPFQSVAFADLDLDGNLEVIGGGSKESGFGAGTFVYVFDYLTRVEEWHSVQMGGTNSKITEVAVADTDLDGFPEILGMVEAGSVYVYEGASKVLEAIISGRNTTMSVMVSGPHRYLLLGDNSGFLTVREWNGASYGSVYQKQMAYVALDGITKGPPGYAFVGADEKLRLVSIATGASLWISADYGSRFGTQLLMTNGAGTAFLTAGGYSVVGFVR